MSKVTKDEVLAKFAEFQEVLETYTGQGCDYEDVVSLCALSVKNTNVVSASYSGDGESLILLLATVMNADETLEFVLSQTPLVQSILEEAKADNETVMGRIEIEK